MKRILNTCLLLTFLIGYLEWGKGSHLFIFQGEAEVFSKALKEPFSVLHPFILIPFFGQLMLLFSIFQKIPSRFLSLAGLACLGLLMIFLFFIGVSVPNFKILGSTIPFIITGFFVLRYNWKREVVD